MEMQWKYCISPVCDKQIQFQSTTERRKSKNNCLNQIIHTKELKLKTELTNKMQALIMKLIIKLSITIWVYICVIVLQLYCFSQHKRNQYSDGSCLVFTSHLNQILWFNAMQNCCVWQPNNGKSYKNNHLVIKWLHKPRGSDQESLQKVWLLIAKLAPVFTV